MFYHIQVLSKKGPLGTIWLAAHHDKRLKRSEVYAPDLPNSIDSIIQPEIPLALRLSGQLMLGVVRLYTRKVSYLFQDCADSFGRMKKSAGSKKQQREAVNLSKEALNASVQAITLPELEEDPDFMHEHDVTLGHHFAGSVPGTPISLIGSLVSTPEKLRRASIGSENALEGLRRSLSFEASPHAGGSPFAAAVEMDDMIFADDEKFGSQMEDEMEFDIEPEKLRSEDIELATPVRDEKGRTTLTPVQEGGLENNNNSPDLEEVAPFNMESPAENAHLDIDISAGDLADGGAGFATPEVGKLDLEKDLSLLPKQKRRKVVRLVFDVNANTGEKQISLDNKYVRSRLRNAEDTLRDLEKDVIEQSLLKVSHRAKRAKTSSRRKSKDNTSNTLGLGEGPVSVRGSIMCEDLLGLFGNENSASAADGGKEGLEEEERHREDLGLDPEMHLQGDELEAEHFESPLDMGGFGTPEVPYDDHFAGPSPGNFQEDLYKANEAEEEEQQPGSSPAQAEAEETLEVDEEGWSSRTKQVLSVVKSKLVSSSSPSSSRRATTQKSSSCRFEEVLPKTRAGHTTKRDAATHFFECLVLSSKGYVNLDQQSAYSPITITARDLLSQEA
jgi:cohesin complex subunit SCC1